MNLYNKTNITFNENYSFDTTIFKYIIWYDIKIIKNKINNSIFINSIKTFPKNKIILDLEKQYNNDIGTILIFTRPLFINIVDVKYFIPSNLIDLINNVNIFEEKKLIQIISNLLLRYSEIIKKIVLDELVLLYKFNKNIRQIYIIDYIINYLEIVNEFKKKTNYKQLHEINNEKYNINFKNINFNIKSKSNLCLSLSLNTTDSLLINWIIKKFSKNKILNYLKICLKKEKCLIKEIDLINILNLYTNSEDIIKKTIWSNTIIPEKLLYHEYLNAFKLFDKYYNNDKIIYISGLTDQIIKYIKNFDSKLDILLENKCIYRMIIQNYIVLDFIISSTKYIDYFITKGFKLPTDYFNKLFKSQYFNKYSRITKINKNINKYLKQDLNTTLKNIYNNLIKLDIPLNDLIIGNFINIIPEEKIINFYKKKSDIDELIPYIIYKKRYNLLDKLFELKIISLEHYKNKFDFYIKKIFKNKYYYDQMYILNIYIYNQKKYSIISFNKILKIGLKIKSLDKIKKIVKLYKNIKLKINYKIILNQFLSVKFYPFYIHKTKDSLIRILEYVKPFIKNYSNIFNKFNVINKIIKNSLGLTLSEIKKIKEYRPDYKLNLDLIDCDNSDPDNLLEIVEYVLKEFNNKNIIEKNKIFIMYNNFLKNFLLYFKFSEKNIDKIVYLSNIYPSFNTILNQKNLYELLHKYTFSYQKIMLLEEAKLFKFDIYSNTYIICYLDNSKLELLKYSILKTPYLKYKSYNYLKSFIDYYKLNVSRTGAYKYSYNFYTKQYILFSYILKNIPEKNIIYPENPLYQLKINRPDYIDGVQNDLADILFFNFSQTNDNNILDEL